MSTAAEKAPETKIVQLDSHVDLFNVSGQAAGGGRSSFVWEPGMNLANPGGTVHGGHVTAMLDDAAGLAAASLLDEFRPFPTATMHVDFLRGVVPGRRYTCTGTVVRAGARMTVSDSAVVDADGELCARASCTFSVLLAPHERARRAG